MVQMSTEKDSQLCLLLSLPAQSLLQRQHYKHSIEIKRVGRNYAYRLHRRPTSKQLSPKVWMTILRRSKCEAVSEMTLNLSPQSQSALPDFSQALYTDSPEKLQWNCGRNSVATLWPKEKWFHLPDTQKNHPRIPACSVCM